MNAKERFYSGLAKETIGKITSNTDNWTSFLRTMSRNYEFTYPEQVMIYAQRPNATFCKPYEDWNAENYRRYVKRGSTGIALFVMNRDKPYLRYVFDVADTGVRRSSPELKPWEVTPENRSYVMEAMERTFGVAADGVLEAQLEDIASALAAEYWDDYKKQFLDIVANSFLEEYDELNIEVAFKNAVANSVSYTMYCRFVESPDNYFEHEDFQKVFDFNTRQTVNALGTAVNAISTRMFQEIEKAIGEHEQIKATERSTDYERDDLQTGRRLSDSEPSVGERGRETSGQVRQDASSIFGTEQSDAPERHDSDGEPVPAPVGDRGNGESQSGVSDGAVPEGQPRTGQGNAADGVGAAHEQPESTGGGSRDDGAYQQLSLNLFLSENEQISFIDRAESFTPSAFSFAQEEIDHFLLLGSNTDEARKVVALEYMKQKPLEEIVQTLKQVYHGGYGLKEDSGNICAWYAEDGIHLAKGSSAIDSPRAQIVSWETVAERIGELLENGRFATNVELVEASGYERQKLAESLWHLYHDLSEEARSSNYLAILHQEPFRGFPDETADLAEKLDDPRFHATLVQQYSEFRKTLAENPDLLRFHYHKLNLIQKQLYELNMPLREYQTDMMQMPLVRQFITDDEVNADLTRGSGFSGGKARIYNYWQENHSAKEKMDFLKHEYGTGGHSHACSGATHSGQDHDAKGVAYTKSGCDKLQMSWAQVVQRIDGLIRKGRYLSPEEEAERQAIEEAKTDPLEDVYDRFAVIDTEDGEYAIWDNQTDDYYVDPEGVTEYFTDEWPAKATIAAVKAIIAAVKGLIAAIAAGGWVAVVVIIVLCLVALIAGSVFGIFFSGEDSGTGMSMQTVVQEINQEYDDRLEQEKNSVSYDVLEMSGSRAVWKDVLAVYSVKVNTDPDNPMEVATVDETKKQLLSDIFWEMNDISSRTETKTHTEIEESDDGHGNIVQTETTVTETFLYITVSHKTVDEMAAMYGFNQEQKEYLAELLKDENNQLWSQVLYGIGYSDDQIVTVALSQVGNVGGQPYWSWYGFDSRVEWCACFVSWCANECGYIDAGIIPKYAGCVNGVQWFRDRGQWADGSYEPSPGTIIFFDWEGDGVTDHTGIVQKCENGTVYTVEGNSGDTCRTKTYPVGSSVIYGYGIPAY